MLGNPASRKLPNLKKKNVFEKHNGYKTMNMY
jgi:hypothetical protein